MAVESAVIMRTENTYQVADAKLKLRGGEDVEPFRNIADLGPSSRVEKVD